MSQKLLLIDDSAQVHSLIKSLLRNEPVEIHSAANAEAGLRLVKSLRPDLILMDVNMPRIDGFEACRRLKSEPAHAAIPLILLVERGSMDQKMRGLDLGADDYVTKPCDRAELVARVRASLRMSRLMRMLEEKAMIDPLTGLGNRAMFEKRLGAENTLRNRSSAPLASIMLDLDQFPSINSSCGQFFADSVLRKIGAILLELCRSRDLACRLRGEQFAVLAPNTTAQEATVLAERMRAAIAKAVFFHGDKSISITSRVDVVDAGAACDRFMAANGEARPNATTQTGRPRLMKAATAA
jgi:diguanylate cyclase (GGDEF)-like protein